MATDLYKSLQKMASDVIAKYQTGTVILMRSTQRSSDPNAPWSPGSQTVQSYPLHATVSGVKRQHVDGTLIQFGDLMLVCNADIDVTPQMEDVISIDGKPHDIRRIVPVPAAGTPVTYTIFVRG